MFCAHCGGSNPDDARFCQYCGSALTASAPLPSLTPPPPPPAAPGWGPTGSGGAYPSSSPYPSQGGSPPRRRRSRILVILVIVVVVILVVSVVAYELAPSPSPPVQVGIINVWAPDNVCGLLSNPNANPTSYYGYNASTSETDAWTFSVPNYNGTPCTIHSVVTNTSGFSLSSIQVPLTIPASDPDASMNITITTPSSSYSGNLNLVFA